jgi:hypothetical protein
VFVDKRIDGRRAMSPGVQIILSGMLTFGVPLTIAVTELTGLRRGGAGRGRRAAPVAPTPPPPLPGLAPTRPLPACLIPQPRTSRPRPRVLEPT